MNSCFDIQPIGRFAGQSAAMKRPKVRVLQTHKNVKLYLNIHQDGGFWVLCKVCSKDWTSFLNSLQLPTFPKDRKFLLSQDIQDSVKRKELILILSIGNRLFLIQR